MNLVGNSKLGSLVKPVSKYSPTQIRHKPTHQTIQTTAASLYRHDFGLKAALPDKVKSRYIVLDELDTYQRLTEFEAVPGAYWNKLRFQEFGLPVTASNGIRTKSALFKNDSQDTAIKRKFGQQKFEKISEVLGLDESSSSSEVNAVTHELKGLRKDFQQWVLENHPSKLTAKRFNKDSLSYQLITYLKQRAPVKKNKKFLKQGKTGSIAGTGGLSYLQPGRLTNVPQGINDVYVSPSRIAGDNDTLAVGGFITPISYTLQAQATASRAASGKHYKEIMISCGIKGATMKEDGSVGMQTVGVIRKSDSFKNDSEFLRDRYKDSSILSQYKRSRQMDNSQKQDILNLFT